MKIPIYQVDAFTSDIFRGNPAAVCPLEQWLSNEVMQNISLENNLSETAFFVKNDDKYEIRWFTPTIEVDLCGHATLASGFVIMEYIAPELNAVNFFSPRSGNLKVIREKDKYTLDFPSTPGVSIETPQLLVQGLGKNPLEVLLSDDYLAVFGSEQEIIDIVPNFQILGKLDKRGVIITAPGKKADFVSRFFAPNAGVDEDPVTGSAHCTLTPYWYSKFNKKELYARQLSSRGGELSCEYHEDRVLISGNAVCYMTGNIFI